MLTSADGREAGSRHGCQQRFGSVPPASQNRGGGNDRPWKGAWGCSPGPGSGGRQPAPLLPKPRHHPGSNRWSWAAARHAGPWPRAWSWARPNRRHLAALPPSLPASTRAWLGQSRPARAEPAPAAPRPLPHPWGMKPHPCGAMVQPWGAGGPRGGVSEPFLQGSICVARAVVSCQAGVWRGAL